MTENIGDRFQKDTKYDRRKMAGGGLDWGNKPDIYKEYPDSNKIELPHPETSKLHGTMILNDVLKKRKSIRNFTRESLTLEQLSYLLWASTGIQREEMGYEFRTAPSAGALYPIETYLIINYVKGIPNGVYHYNIKNHELEELEQGEFGKEISFAALNQGMCSKAAVVFVHTALFQRSKWKYKQRGYRYIYIDAGHIGENLALAAVSLELGSCHIGAIFDDEANRIIGVDGEAESVIYLTVVGRYG
jgi:SagB-type dehydrogenase family enzyme